MKKLLGIVVLSFLLSVTSKADDIRDFEIEGISIGDSLLKSYSKTYLDSLEKLIYPGSDKYFQISINNEKSDYDDISFVLKKNDNKYVIYNIGLAKFFENDLLNCKKFMKIKIDEILSIVKNLKEKTYEHQYNIDDKKSLAYITDFIFPDESSLRAYCVNWSDATEKKRNFTDNFSLDLSLRAYLDWLNNEAY